MTRAARSRAARFVGAAVLLAVIAGCATSPALQDTIALENRTTTPVLVDVNGGWAGTYPAGSVVNVPITGHGGPPYDVEVRSPGGAVLQSLTISATDVQDAANGGGSRSGGGNVGCGWIELGYGVRVVPSAAVPAQDATRPCP